LISANIYTEAISLVFGTLGSVIGIQAIIIARAARREAKAANLNGKAYLDAAWEHANEAGRYATDSAEHLTRTVAVAKTAAIASVDAQAAADASKNHSIAAKDYAKQTHELMGKVVTVTQPVAQGHAVCAVCKRTVARFTVTLMTGAVCVNCNKE
jgi:hypothetical protein